MANDVFANNLEIACKAADGKSIAAFPDPCWTPPSPPAGWILVPYPNTSYAKDTANASKTVFISGKPIMKKDVSYFSTSTGNEAAAGPLGLITGVKKGKTYFTSWSMNVMIESQNVDRHTDLMTHNHGSAPGNTAVWAYLDSAVAKACKDVCKEIEKKCGKGSACFGKENNRNRRRKPETESAKKKKNFKNAFLKEFNKFAKKNGFTLKREKTWKDKHCTMLLIKPGNTDEQLKRVDEKIKEVEKTLKELPKKIKDLDLYSFSERIKQGLRNVAPDNLLELIPFVKGAKNLRRVSKVLNGAELVQAGKEVSKEIANIVKNTKELLQTLKNQKAMLRWAKNGTPKEIAEELDRAAGRNKCIKARRCLLEPYSKSEFPKPLFSKEGCCPGQTAHHLMPHSYFQSDDEGKIPGCEKYTYDSAPTVCAEGGNETGSHGRLHKAQDKKAAAKIKNGKLYYEDAKEAAIQAHMQAFPGACARGKKSCLGAQLDHYYKDRCKKRNFRVKPKKTDAAGGMLEGGKPYPENNIL